MLVWGVEPEGVISMFPSCRFAIRVSGRRFCSDYIVANSTKFSTELIPEIGPDDLGQASFRSGLRVGEN